MKAKLNRLRLRDLALFVVVAGIVAVVAVFAAREAGLGGPGAEAQSSPLTLALSAPAICETGYGIGGDHSTRLYDDDGNPTGWKDEFLGWFDVAEVPVKWRVVGGVAPYTLEIDGETRDAAREYRGASGKASVSCAITTVEPFIFTTEGGTPPKRAYRADPKVDSGTKTIRAVVTGANGDTAEAAVDVYVILGTDDWRHLLKGGETYRVDGHLITVPLGINLEFGEHSSGSVSALSFFVSGTGAYIWLNTRTFEEVGRWLPEQSVQGAAAGIDLGAKLDELVDSVGRSPSLNRSGQ